MRDRAALILISARVWQDCFIGVVSDVNSRDIIYDDDNSVNKRWVLCSFLDS